MRCRSACVLGLGAALAALCVPAAAQTSAVATAEIAGDPTNEAFLGPHRSLDALCEAAAVQPWAHEMRNFGLGMRCVLSDLSSRPLSAVEVRTPTAARVYLAARDGEGLRVVTLLDAVEWLPTESGLVEVVGVRESASDAGLVVAVETRAEYVNHEGSEALGWNRRRVTFCVERRTRARSFRCALRLPLLFESWSGASPTRSFAATDGYTITSRARASATAVLRPDGSVRHTLRAGTWYLLFGGGWFAADVSWLRQESRQATYRIGDAPPDRQ